ncbi:hypothetical protein D0Z07_8610 [Hyphodiscus hymeniophilus]|uniref:Uncharacterized protein n=1 Tax=Hyphodiscus hymeniophilus TaxID=353542 RepID=A0A9P6SN85_9HELO|nr:hypothetical protein D0Z07_8610 [Hyphodiscus hymeniophilus]
MAIVLRNKFFLASALSLPATAILVKLFLHNHPLSSFRTRTIESTETLSPTSATSFSIHNLVDPNNHLGIVDSRSIRLLKSQVGSYPVEEILARFLKGFFGGWVFTPERLLIASLNGIGMKFIPVQFSKIKPKGPTLSSLGDFSSTELPPRHTMLWGCSFIVLDYQIISPSPTHLDDAPPSFIEIGFGDDRKRFAGLHRFEVTRSRDGGATICFSSFSCNPTVNKAPFPKWIFRFHLFYAQCLFRDGIREVLST